MTRPRIHFGILSKCNAPLVGKSIQILSMLAALYVTHHFKPVSSDWLGSVITELMFFKEANDMSGSRGEANFVWKCKSCKVILYTSHIYYIHKRCSLILLRENLRQPSRRLQSHINKLLHQPGKRSLNLTAEVWSSPNSSQR